MRLYVFFTFEAFVPRALFDFTEYDLALHSNFDDNGGVGSLLSDTELPVVVSFDTMQQLIAIS
jgi:hypothetical protein